MITSQGDAFKEKLMSNKLVLFNNGMLIVRESKTEGHRICAAFQPANFMKELLQEFELLNSYQVVVKKAF